MSSKRTGSSLAATLCFIAVLVTLAMTMSSYSISHMTGSRRAINDKLARDMAESAMSMAVGKIMDKQDWAGDIEFAPPEDPGTYGRVTFSALKARNWHIDPSFNNLSGNQPVQASGRTLGPESLQIVAYGTSHGVTTRIEQIIHIPPFRYALVSSGDLSSVGGMLVGGVDDPSLLANGVSALRPEQLQNGYLAANSSAAQAVLLDSSAESPTRITGGVEAVGGIKLGKFTRVAGPVQEHAAPAHMVAFRLEDYDPKERGDVNTLTDSAVTQLIVRGVNRRQGDLSIAQGLDIRSGYLYVDGNLTVDGGIRGTGCVFATGKVTLRGVSTFAADAREAILAGGDIRIEGSDQDKSLFQGVIYTQGDFSARQVTLLGTVLASKTQIASGSGSSGSSSGGSKVELDRVNLIHNAEIIATEWDAGFNVAPELQGDSMPVFNSDAVNQANMKVALGNKPKDFFDASKNRFTMEPGDHVLVPKYLIDVPQFAAQENGKFYRFHSLDELLAVLNDPARKQSIRANSVTNPPTVEYVPEEVVLPDGTRITTQKEVFGGGSKPVSDASDPAFQSMVRKFTMTAQDIIWNQVVPQAVAEYQRMYEEHHWPWMSQEHWGMSFDPNQFIQMSDKARKLLVRETAPNN